MGVEIERKFLVDTGMLAEAGEPERSVHYRQGFLSIDPAAVVRVRVSADEGLICVKGLGRGITRPEFDYEIPVADARAMLALCGDRVVEKIRHHYTVDGKKWVVDEFLGDNRGLWLAEIELERENEDFTRPPWAGREVSDDARYYNVNLATNPYARWNPAAAPPPSPGVLP